MAEKSKMADRTRARRDLAAVRIVLSLAIKRAHRTLKENKKIDLERRMVAAVAVLSYGYSEDGAARAFGLKVTEVTESVCEFSQMRLCGDEVVISVENFIEQTREKQWGSEKEGIRTGGSWCLGFWISEEDEMRMRTAKIEAKRYEKKLCAPPKPPATMLKRIVSDEDKMRKHGWLSPEREKFENSLRREVKL